jgi:uncharacterized cupin superfamily protein
MLPELFLSFKEADGPALTTYPNGWTVIEGSPSCLNKRLYQNDEMKRFSGVWQCSPGKFAVDYKVWEFCHFIRGRSIITNESGKRYELTAGDSFLLEAGFRGEWEVIEPVEKHYVIQA